MTAVQPPEFLDADQEADLISRGQWPIPNNAYGGMRELAEDFFCTFSAPKRVVISRRQGRMAGTAGCLYWILFFGLAVCYFIGFQVIFLNNHLKYETPMGATRVALKRPTVFNATSGHACSPQTHGCSNTFNSVRTMPFCLRSEGMAYDGEKLKCKFWDEDSVVGRELGSEVLIVTKVKLWDQTKICDGTDAETCPHTFTSNERDKYYIADVANFTVNIAHSVRTESMIGELQMQTRSYGMEVCGDLIAGMHPPSDDDDGDDDASSNSSRLRNGFARAQQKMRSLGLMAPPCDYIASNGALAAREYDHTDTYRLATILRAAGADLDATGGGEAHRRNVGMSLMVTLEYWNTAPFVSWAPDWIPTPFAEREVKYKIQVQEMPVKGYHVRDTAWVDQFDGQHRLVVEKFGIRFVVQTSGRIGSFSVSQTCILFSVSLTVIFLAEKMVVMWIRFGKIVSTMIPVLWCFGWESGGIRPEHLAENFNDNAHQISGHWVESYKKAKTEPKLSPSAKTGPEYKPLTQQSAASPTAQ